MVGRLRLKECKDFQGTLRQREHTAPGCVGSTGLHPVASLQTKTALKLPLSPNQHYYWVMIHLEVISQTAVYHYSEHKCFAQQSRSAEICWGSFFKFPSTGTKSGVDLHPQLQRLVRIHWILPHQAPTSAGCHASTSGLDLCSDFFCSSIKYFSHYLMGVHFMQKIWYVPYSWSKS